MRIKVVTSNPAGSKGYEQDHIDSIIGREYEVVLFDKDDDSVSVIEPEFWKGEIVLNKEEYVRV